MVGSYERVESNGCVEHRHYIGGNTLITTTASGAKHQQHFIRDHIGSVVAVVDQNGSVLQRKRYTVFGEEIETFTASGLPQMLGITEKGFTHHEHIPGFQLIHMGGRLYHPRLGRFLQADIVIQNTKAPVNFSRYAYVMNNPLGYTDPSGYAWYKPWTWGGGGDSDSSEKDNDKSNTANNNDSTNTAPEQGNGDYSDATNPDAGNEGESQFEPEKPNGGGWWDRTKDFFSGKLLKATGSAAKQVAAGVGKAALDVLGKVWASPATAIGIAHGVAGMVVGNIGYLAGVYDKPVYPTLGHNAIQFLNNPLMAPNSAITFGNVISYAPGVIPEKSHAYNNKDVIVGRHEEAHTFQYQRLGIFFPLAYFQNGGANHEKNPFEQAAQNYGSMTNPGHWMPSYNPDRGIT